MVESILTVKNLRKGINNFRSHPHWESDFHNEIYRRLFEWRQRGFNEIYWSNLVDELGRWRALRGSYKDDILNRGYASIGILKKHYLAAIDRQNGIEPDLSSIRWEEIEPLFTFALRVKKTKTPSVMFASKLCHFVMPNCFVIVDSEFNDSAEDSDDYGYQWEYWKMDWTKCNIKDELIQILKAEIGDSIIQNYPFSTKIIELCSSAN